MPLIFVHGVNNRVGPSYEAGRLATEKFLQTYLGGAVINGKTLPVAPSIAFPYWGGLATTFAWNMASLPSGPIQALGGSAQVELRPLVAHVRDSLDGPLPPEPLTELAKKDFASAAHLLATMALDQAEPTLESGYAEYAVQVSEYASENPAPPWVSDVVSDAQFVSALNARLAAAPPVQALGGLGSVFNKVALAATRLKQAVLGVAGTAVDRAGDLASTRLLAWSRDDLNATIGRFFGDIFIYFDGRGDRAHPGPIPKLVLDAFDSVLRGAPPDEPFVVVGHSLGGVISMDLLSHFRPDLEVDLFVSVGSQVAHFEELKLYRASDRKVGPPNRVPRPPNIKRWINVFDRVDIFAYSVNGVFDHADIDVDYDTGTYTIKAHSAYFEQAAFYKRLRARIDQL